MRLGGGLTNEHLMDGRNANGSPLWQVQLLALLARGLRIQFKVGALPYGASFERALNHAPLRSSRMSAGFAGNSSGHTAGGLLGGSAPRS
jgi:hypothetical protein